MGDSRELARIAVEARAIAEEARQPLSTPHLLFALFTVSNPAELMLKARGVDEKLLLARLKEVPVEEPRAFETLLEKARSVAQGTGAAEAQALHLLIALATTKSTGAYDLLAQVVPSTAALAREALSYVVGPLPRRFLPRVEAEPPPAAPTSPARPAHSTSTPSQQPSGSTAAAPATVTASTLPPARPTSQVSVLDPPETAATEQKRNSRLSKVRRLAQGLEAEASSSPFVLSPEELPYLASLGRNLTELAFAGRIDPVIGRDREIDEVLDVLGKRRANNPVLVGDPGVGKTAVVEGVALELVRQASLGQTPRIIVELDVAGLLAGTELRGSLSEKLNGIKDDVRRAQGRVVVFIDEIHTLVGAGKTGEGAQDAANELKAALARGEFPCIGATTFAEFQRYFAQDSALERRFVPLEVDEPSVAETIEILRGLTERYAAHHGVSYDEEAVEAAAQLSHRFIRDRALPDKAVALLDYAGSRAARSPDKRVTRDEIAKAVARIARVPEERVRTSDAARVLHLEEALQSRVVGHRAAVERVARAVRRNFAGFSGQRPLASFLFLGPTGVGKTLLAKGLAEAVYGGGDALARVDMSELSEGHSVAKLVGAPPGYVGFGEGGLLTEEVRRNPASVVLLDEIEKAHRDSQQLVLQLLDEGHLTDGRGRRVDFTNAIVVLTSNLGAEAFRESGERTVGFLARSVAPADRAARALSLAKEAFLPELWNRIEEKLVFEPLSRDDLKRVAHLVAAESSDRLFEDKQIRFSLDDSAVDHLLEHGGFDPLLGARPLRQALARLVEAPLAERILKGEMRSGDRVRIVARGERLDFEQLTIVDASRSLDREPP